MNLQLAPYLQQKERWPKAGRHILAHFDADSIVVYQAFNPRIGRFAAENQFFGGDFKLSRMSWIKPNFLWMMYRCGWGSKPEQESVLAVRLRRAGFETILSRAVHSAHDPRFYSSHNDWSRAVKTSEVRLQWDPDHHPAGAPLERRAIQLGLSGDTLCAYARDWIVSIEDISPFVRQQGRLVQESRWSELMLPSESVFPITEAAVAARVGAEAHRVQA
ncbi:MAG TPA: DUF4291 domain-containing protein [Tepidisphaeraceae bacterium]|nr:DUF4291 domain-containing protein [Tepidisphaeraceae bacterium]